jgi:galactoside O-acetyltransferase
MKSRFLRFLQAVYPTSCALDVAASATFNILKLHGGKGNRLTIKENSLVHASLFFDRPSAQISIGARSFIGNSRLVCAEKLTIGNDVLVSWAVTMADHDSHSLDFERRKCDVTNWIAGHKDWSNVPRAPITIEDKVWIGFGSIILKGVTVGTGAVVAAGSVVTRNVSPWTVVAGNPAKPIKQLEAQST